MNIWTTSVLILILLHTVSARAQMAVNESKPVTIEEIHRPAADLPHPLALPKRDFAVVQAYADVFKILSDQNTCSSFYGGPRPATIVLNSFIPAVESHRLLRDVTFKMSGRPQMRQDLVSGASYRLFEKVTVNSDSSFYQRRVDSVRFPPDVGSFPPGTRAARALILLHELGHLIQHANGAWLIPDDGYDDSLSQRNTLRIQQACRTQLRALM
jgi:hypothetical protein